MNFESRKPLKTQNRLRPAKLHPALLVLTKFKTLWTYMLLGAIAFVMLFPLLWLISTSFKSPAENIFQFPPQLLPSQPTIQKFCAQNFGWLADWAIAEGETERYSLLEI
jgi:ABC-type glycerol-3-phosphate transport system permease component